MATLKIEEDITPLLDLLDYLKKEVKAYIKHGCEIDAEFTISNTGITRISCFIDSDGWAQYVDLGGRNIKLNIALPNKKTLMMAENELIKKNKNGSHRNRNNSL